MDLDNRVREESAGFWNEMLLRFTEIFVQGRHTNKKVLKKIQAATGEYDDPGQETSTKMIWLKIFWFSKDNSKEHSERKK